jgi:hypothetical protein
MKKILVVLLILAMAGGVFAQQGDWSIGGSVEVGTRLDFDPQPDVDGADDPALVDGIAYWDWDQPRGLLDIGYSRGIVNVGVRLNSKADAVFDVAFNGDEFKGQFKVNNPLQALSGSGGDTGWWGPTIERLWGEYKFVNGIVTIQAANSSPDTEFWVSDKTGTFFDTQLASYPSGSGDTSGAKDLRVSSNLGSDNPYYTGWKTNIIFDKGQTFTKVDHHNYLLIGADVSSISFGIIVPNLFIAKTAWANYSSDPTMNYGTELLAHSLPYTVLGIKFSQSPLEIAAQFQMKNYGAYFGGKFFAGPITVGLSFTGVLDANGNDAANDSDPKQIKIGGRVDYNGGAFGGGIKGFYSRDGVPYDAPGLDGYVSIVGVEPTFFFNAIPSHLRFNLDLGMYFLSDINETTGAEKKQKEVIWAVQPQVFWNFLGTGATDSYWGDFQTGVILRYRLAVADLREFDLVGSKQGANFLDVVFKLSF